MLKHYNQTGYALILNQQGRIHQVLIDKIRYIELDRYLISVCTGESAQQESYEVVSPLNYYEEMLLPHGFFRISRKHIINLRYLTRLDTAKRQAYLQGYTTSLNVSRECCRKLRHYLLEHEPDESDTD